MSAILKIKVSDCISHKTTRSGFLSAAGFPFTIATGYEMSCFLTVTTLLLLINIVLLYNLHAE